MLDVARFPQAGSAASGRWFGQRQSCAHRSPDLKRELSRGPAVIKPGAGFGRIEIPDVNVADVEGDAPAGIESCLHQVSDEFVLGVQRSRASAREVRERDAMALTIESRLDPMVNTTFLPHSLPDAGLVQQVDSPLLEHSGSQRRFDFSPTARLKYHRGDASPVQQVRQ